MDRQSLGPMTWDGLKDFLDGLEEFGELKLISTCFLWSRTIHWMEPPWKWRSKSEAGGGLKV